MKIQHGEDQLFRLTFWINVLTFHTFYNLLKFIILLIYE